MRSRERVIWDLVHQWLFKADRDLEAARILLEELDHDYEAVGFHAQQAAEKYLKALLIRHQVEFPKTHDIRQLLCYLEPVDARLCKSLMGATDLTVYGVEFRYPGDYPPADKREGSRLLELAETVSRGVLEHLKMYLDAGPPV